MTQFLAVTLAQAASPPQSSPATPVQIEGLPPSAPAPGGAASGGPTGVPLIPAGPGSPPPRPATSGDLMTSFLPMLVVVVVFFVMVSLMNRRQDKKKVEMLQSLGKRDKVQTVGGVIGEVEEVGTDDVIVRTAESTRIHFAKTAVVHILKKHGAPAASAQAEAKPQAEKSAV